MDQQEIMNRFKFHPATKETGPKHNDVRAILGNTAIQIESIVPDGRELSLAITKLEEAMMWANAGIARYSGERQNSSS